MGRIAPPIHREDHFPNDVIGCGRVRIIDNTPRFLKLLVAQFPTGSRRGACGHVRGIFIGVLVATKKNVVDVFGADWNVVVGD
jgi:hypothetical protein